VPDLCQHTDGWEVMQVGLVHVTIHWAHQCDMRTIAPNLQQLCTQQCHCTAVDAGPFSHLFHEHNVNWRALNMQVNGVVGSQQLAPSS
jgi:hypothetical protein